MRVTGHMIIVADEGEFFTIGDPERSRMHVTHNNANIDKYGSHRREEQHKKTQAAHCYHSEYAYNRCLQMPNVGHIDRQLETVKNE